MKLKHQPYATSYAIWHFQVNMFGSHKYNFSLYVIQVLDVIKGTPLSVYLVQFKILISVPLKYHIVPMVPVIILYRFPFSIMTWVHI